MYGISDAILLRLSPAPPAAEMMHLVSRHFDADMLYFSRVRALFATGDGSHTNAVIHAIKYGGMRRTGTDLGSMLARVVCDEWDSLPTGVIPVPIHQARLRERGYNQSHDIAIGVSNVIGNVILNDVLVRKYYTSTQTNYSSGLRLINVSDVFEVIDALAIKGKHLALVDDVLTTGATANACAKALLDCGARRVDVFALAIAM